MSHPSITQLDDITSLVLTKKSKGRNYKRILTYKIKQWVLNDSSDIVGIPETHTYRSLLSKPLRAALLGALGVFAPNPSGTFIPGPTSNAVNTVNTGGFVGPYSGLTNDVAKDLQRGTVAPHLNKDISTLQKAMYEAIDNKMINAVEFLLALGVDPNETLQYINAKWGFTSDKDVKRMTKYVSTRAQSQQRDPRVVHELSREIENTHELVQKYNAIVRGPVHKIAIAGGNHTPDDYANALRSILQSDSDLQSATFISRHALRNAIQQKCKSQDGLCKVDAYLVDLGISAYKFYVNGAFNVIRKNHEPLFNRLFRNGLVYVGDKNRLEETCRIATEGLFEEKGKCSRTNFALSPSPYLEKFRNPSTKERVDIGVPYSTEEAKTKIRLSNTLLRALATPNVEAALKKIKKILDEDEKYEALIHEQAKYNKKVQKKIKKGTQSKKAHECSDIAIKSIEATDGQMRSIFVSDSQIHATFNTLVDWAVKNRKTANVLQWVHDQKEGVPVQGHWKRHKKSPVKSLAMGENMQFWNFEKYVHVVHMTAFGLFTFTVPKDVIIGILEGTRL